MKSFLKVHTDYDTDRFLKVFTDSDTVRFRCSGLEKNEIEFADLFDAFLLDLSKGKNTFIHTFLLADISKLVDESTIISRADVLLNPTQTFFHVSELKAKSANFGDDNICEADFMFFDKKVKWGDFLASYRNIDFIKLIKSGLLSAHFSVTDHGADFEFEADIKKPGIVQTFFRQLSELGWQIHHCKNYKGYL